MPAAAAYVGAHVFHDPEDRDGHLLEHLQTLPRVEQCDVLRCRDDHGTAYGHPLRQGQLDVPGARRHVDDQIVELAPVCFTQELGEGLGHHRAAPDHRLLFLDQEPDRHRAQAVGCERLEPLAVARDRPLAGQPQHPGLAWAVDIRIKQPDPGASRASPSARLTATVDFPTPPLPEAIASTLRIPGNGCRPAGAACWATSQVTSTRASPPPSSLASSARARSSRYGPSGNPSTTSATTVPPSNLTDFTALTSLKGVPR